MKMWNNLNKANLLQNKWAAKKRYVWRSAARVDAPTFEDISRHITNLRVLRWIYSHGDSDVLFGCVSIRKRDIQFACRTGSMRVVRWLCAQFKTRPMLGEKALEFACESGSYRVAAWVVRKKPSLCFNKACLFWACTKGNVRLARFIMHRDNIEITNKHLWNANRSGSFRMLRFVMNSINAPFEFGYVDVRHICQSRDDRFIRWAFKRCGFLMEDYLWWFAGANDIRFVKKILQNPAITKDQKKDGLYALLYTNDIDSIRWYSKAVNVKPDKNSDAYTRDLYALPVWRWLLRFAGRKTPIAGYRKKYYGYYGNRDYTAEHNFCAFHWSIQKFRINDFKKKKQLSSIK